MNKIYLFILLIALGASACKTAGKAFDRGAYEEAVALAVRQLQRNGGDESTRTLLQNAYQRAVKQHEANIRSLSSSNSDSRFEKIYYEYRKLQNLYESINRSPEATSVVNPMDYSSYVQTFREKTGDVYFERGLRLMEKGDRHSFRRAYQELKTAYRFRNDLEVKEKMEEAYDASVVKVLILTDNNMYDNGFGAGMYDGMHRNRFFDVSTSFQIRNFQEDLVRNLRFHGGSEFVRFLTEWETRSNNVRPDEIIEMRLGRLDLGRFYDQTSSRDVSQRVIVRTIMHKPDSVVHEYATVRARVNITRRHFISFGDLHIIARDGNGRYLWSDLIRGENRFVLDFATYTGDERALSENDRAMIRSSQQQHPFNTLRQDDIFRDLFRQIEQQAVSRFRNYYSRFY